MTAQCSECPMPVCKPYRKVCSKACSLARKNRFNAEIQRSWLASNRDKINAQRRLWRAIDPDKAREKQRQRRTNNREIYREHNRRWREANREEHNYINSCWRKANLSRCAEYSRKWRETNPDSYLAIRIKSAGKKRLQQLRAELMK